MGWKKSNGGPTAQGMCFLIDVTLWGPKSVSLTTSVSLLLLVFFQHLGQTSISIPNRTQTFNNSYSLVTYGATLELIGGKMS